MLHGAQPAKLVDQGNVVQNSNAVRGANPFDGFVVEGVIAAAKNAGSALNGGLQNRVVVRVDSRLRQGPSGLNVRVGQHSLDLGQDSR